MASTRARTGIAAVATTAVLAGALLLTGALAPREDATVPTIAIGDVVETSRATITVDAFAIDDEGAYAITMTIENQLDVPLSVDDVVRLADDEGRVDAYGYATVADGVAVPTVQPGVVDTVTLAWDVADVPIVGDVRVDLIDGDWTPRDETALGLAANTYELRVVAIVEPTT